MKKGKLWNTAAVLQLFSLVAESSRYLAEYRNMHELSSAKNSPLNILGQTVLDTILGYLDNIF